MSDQVAYLDDLLLEDSLEEVFHGGPPPELAQRILEAAGSAVREPVAVAQDPTPAPTRAEGRAVSAKPVLRAVPLDPDHPLSLPRWAIWLAQGAVAAGLLILLVVLVFPGEEKPQGVIAAEGSEYEYETGDVPEVQATAGWYVLSDGAPPLTAAGSRVEDVKGQVIVKVGDIPNPDERAAMAPWLAQHQVEAEMNWFKAGALAVCIISGSAFVDGQYLSAQDVKDPRQADKRESDRKDGEAKKDDVAAREDKAKAELEKLRGEITDLEKRLEEARDLEDGKEKNARIERIENALKDKRERIAAIEKRLAGENDKKRDDAAAAKRREAARRKNAEKDDDAAAKERREAERRKKEGENDDVAKERRKNAEAEEARRKAEGDAARKDREAERRKNAGDEEARKRAEEEARKKREADKREKKREQ